MSPTQSKKITTDHENLLVAVGLVEALTRITTILGKIETRLDRLEERSEKHDKNIETKLALMERSITQHDDKNTEVIVQAQWNRVLLLFVAMIFLGSAALSFDKAFGHLHDLVKSGDASPEIFYQTIIYSLIAIGLILAGLTSRFFPNIKTLTSVTNTNPASKIADAVKDA